MKHRILLVLLSSTMGLALGACSDMTEYFVENPAVVSSCANFYAEWGNVASWACVECDSESNEKAEVEMCGFALKARCNADDASPPVFGIAFAFIEDIESNLVAYKGSTAWLDTDDPAGPSGSDDFICHEQSGGFAGFKHESKCAYPLKGNGKDAGITFETEIKYDPAKDNCN